MNDVVKRKMYILQALMAQKNQKDVPMFIPIKKQMVDSFDIEPLYDFFHLLTNHSDFVRCYRNRIGFEYEGFHGEEVFKVQSLRKFLQKFQEQFPYMFWFSVKTAPGGIDVLFLKGYLYSQCRMKRETDLGDYVMRELEEKDVADFLSSSELGVRELQKTWGLSEAEVMDCLTEVVRYIKKNVFRNFQPFEKWSRDFN